MTKAKLAPPAETPDTMAALLEEAARVDWDDLDLDLDDPAFRDLVDDAVAPFVPVLTPEGVDEVRFVATVALATHPDMEQILERRRGQPAPGGSGVRAKRSPSRLEEAERQRRDRVGKAPR
jgi:hypothetical protein